MTHTQSKVHQEIGSPTRAGHEDGPARRDFERVGAGETPSTSHAPARDDRRLARNPRKGTTRGLIKPTPLWVDGWASHRVPNCFLGLTIVVARGQSMKLEHVASGDPEPSRRSAGPGRVLATPSGGPPDSNDDHHRPSTTDGSMSLALVQCETPQHTEVAKGGASDRLCGSASGQLLRLVRPGAAPIEQEPTWVRRSAHHQSLANHMKLSDDMGPTRRGFGGCGRRRVRYSPRPSRTVLD